MIDNQNNQDFKSSWNMQSLLTMGAYQERKAANECFLKAEYTKAIRHLIALKQMLIGVLTPEEREAAIKMEQQFIIGETADLSTKQKSKFDDKTKSDKVVVRQVLHKLYSQYNDYIMDLLQKKNLLLSAKQDESRLSL